MDEGEKVDKNHVLPCNPGCSYSIHPWDTFKICTESARSSAKGLIDTHLPVVVEAKVETQDVAQVKTEVASMVDTEGVFKVETDVAPPVQAKVASQIQAEIASKVENDVAQIETEVASHVQAKVASKFETEVAFQDDLTDIIRLKADIIPQVKTETSSEEINQELQKSSSLKMDDEFDIDKFLGTIKEKELPASASNNEITEELSDDDFINQLPEVDLNQSISKIQNLSIAEDALTLVDPVVSLLNLNTSEGVLKENHQNFQSQNVRKRVSTSLKRRVSDIIINDRNSDGSSLKKFKIDDSVKENSGLFNKSTSDEDSYNNNNKNMDINSYNSNEGSNLDENNLNCNMSFPNMGEDINFDVNALANSSNFYNHSLSDKLKQKYMRERFLTSECIEQLYNSLMNIPKDEIERDPYGLNTQLMPHQRQALQWMKWREKQKPSGGILADDMGLGKTIQLISLVLATKNENRGIGMDDDIDDDFDDDWGICNTRQVYQGRTLVICPLSLIKQWEKEVNTKLKRGKLSVFVYYGTSRIISKQKLSKYDIVITTYHLIQKEYQLPKKNKDSSIFEINWERVILDEAHYIRNYKSKACEAVCELMAKSRWTLTGTPIQNKESDFYALVKFLKCSPFDEIQVWRRWVSNQNSAGHKRLIVITKSLMLRRTKDELMSKGVIRRLPEKKLDVIEIKLDYEEKLVYQKLLLYSQSFFLEFLRQRKDREHFKEFGCHARSSILCQEIPEKLSKVLKVLMRHHRQIGVHYILVLILKLRQMCCHPPLIKSILEKEDIDMDDNKHQINTDVINELNKLMSDDEEDDSDEDCKINEQMAQNIMSKTNPVFKTDRQSSKVRAILNTIEDIINRGEKVVVVSQWTSFLDVIANHLNYVPDVKYNMFTGKVAVKDRQEIVDKLNDNDDRLNVLLLSLTAGEVGLNLIGANNLLLIDLHWNPQLETQAQDRIYRFGQENNVHIYKFVCKDTIEEKIKLLQDKKLRIAENVLTGSVSNRLTIEDLKLLFS